jgi:hypothetical protein
MKACAASAEMMEISVYFFGGAEYSFTASGAMAGRGVPIKTDVSCVTAHADNSKAMTGSIFRSDMGDSEGFRMAMMPMIDVHINSWTGLRIQRGADRA